MFYIKDVSFFYSNCFFVGIFEVIIRSITGQKMSTLVSEQQQAGIRRFEWDGSDMASGVYFYRLTADDSKGERQNFVNTKKLILLKYRKKLTNKT